MPVTWLKRLATDQAQIRVESHRLAFTGKPIHRQAIVSEMLGVFDRSEAGGESIVEGGDGLVVVSQS